MGCTSAKPKPPPTLNAQPDVETGQLPEKKRSTALFSRGESQIEEVEAAVGKSENEVVVDQSPVPASNNTKKTPPPVPVRTKEEQEAAASQSSGGGVVEVAVTEDDQVAVVAATNGPDVEVVVEKNVNDQLELGQGNEPAEAFNEEKAEVPSARQSVETTEDNGDIEPNGTPQQHAAVEVPVATAFVAPNANLEVTVEDRLNKVQAVLYPSAEAALNSKGLKKYVPELEKRGVVSYRDLADLVEDSSDPFWNRMPPFPDKKKMRTVIEEARQAYDLPAVQSTAPSPRQPETNVVPSEEESSSSAAAEAPPPASPRMKLDADAQVAAADVAAGTSPTTPPAEIAGGDVAVMASEAAAASVAKKEVAEGEVEAELPPTPPRQKQATPCDDYETDIYAADFGMCYCGHPKKSHNIGGGKPAAKAPSYAQRQQAKNHVVVMDAPKDGSVCSNFTLDVKATTFNTCVCGHPKSAHGAQASGPSNRFKEMARGSFNKNSPMVSRQGSGSVDGKQLGTRLSSGSLDKDSLSGSPKKRSAAEATLPEPPQRDPIVSVETEVTINVGKPIVIETREENKVEENGLVDAAEDDQVAMEDGPKQLQPLASDDSLL